MVQIMHSAEYMTVHTLRAALLNAAFLVFIFNVFFSWQYLLCNSTKAVEVQVIE